VRSAARQTKTHERKKECAKKLQRKRRGNSLEELNEITKSRRENVAFSGKKNRIDTANAKCRMVKSSEPGADVWTNPAIGNYYQSVRKDSSS
jgi:hypothetical protein